MRENPVISDRVPIRGDLTEGSLGGRLAQRLAALREVMAAGSRFISCLPSWSLALAVPRASEEQRQSAKGEGQRAETLSAATHGMQLAAHKRKKGTAHLTLCPYP